MQNQLKNLQREMWLTVKLFSWKAPYVLGFIVPLMETQRSVLELTPVSWNDLHG